MKKSDKFE